MTTLHQTLRDAATTYHEATTPEAEERLWGRRQAAREAMRGEIRAQRTARGMASDGGFVLPWERRA